MGKRNVYYLIARETQTNQFRILPVTNMLGSTLEEIDLYTTQFTSKMELYYELLAEGKIEATWQDFFIVNQKKVDGKPVLYTQEVLYSPSWGIRGLAEASLYGFLEFNQYAKQLLDSFCTKMKYDPKFYNRVMFGENSLYDKFKNYFANRRFLDSNAVKYKEGGWVLESYPVLRNIVECFQQHDCGRESYGDRQDIREDLLRATATNTDLNQISLFDLMDDSTGEDSNGFQKRKDE